MSEPYDPNQSYWARDHANYAGYPGPPTPTQYQGQPYSNQPDQAQPDQAQPYQAQQYLNQPDQSQLDPAQQYLPQPYQAQPYAAPGYSIYPYPGYSSPGMGDRGRPGQVVAAAVLSYVEAALLILTGLILFSGSSAVSDWSSNGYGNARGWGAQFAFAGLGDLVAAGLLITGGVMFTGGKRLGRTLLSVGLALCVVEAICWISWLDDSSGGIYPWASFYLVMPIVATSMSYAGSVSRWIDGRGGLN